MSFNVLLTGRLLADPESLTSANGRAYVRARMVVPTDDGDVLAAVRCFSAEVSRQLAALTKGDSAAVTGRAKISTWTGKEGEPRVGLDVVVDGVLTAYALRKRRGAVTGEATDAAG